MRKLSAFQRQIDELRATTMHTILLLKCWENETPFSDIVTGRTHHAYNLPAPGREVTVHDLVSEMMAETGCDYITAAIAHNIGKRAAAEVRQAVPPADALR